MGKLVTEHGARGVESVGKAGVVARLNRSLERRARRTESRVSFWCITSESRYNGLDYWRRGTACFEMRDWRSRRGGQETERGHGGTGAARVDGRDGSDVLPAGVTLVEGVNPE